MRKVKLMLTTTITCTTLLFSCNNIQTQNCKYNAEGSINMVMQCSDGSIALHVDEAEYYRDSKDPSASTAEWNVAITKSGRFNVWLRSAAIDTIDLGYENKVLLNVHDNILEVHPVTNKIDASEINHPYFNADSYMGAMYIQDTGLYSIHVISDKIFPKNTDAFNEKTKLLSVILTPILK